MTSDHSMESLIKVKSSDTLLLALKQMRDKRVSIMPVEALSDDQKTTYTEGICFMNDLLYLLKLPNFWEYLCLPVGTFLKELNCSEDDEDSLLDDADMLFEPKKPEPKQTPPPLEKKDSLKKRQKEESKDSLVSPANISGASFDESDDDQSNN